MDRSRALKVALPAHPASPSPLLGISTHASSSHTVWPSPKSVLEEVTPDNGADPKRQTAVLPSHPSTAFSATDQCFLTTALPKVTESNQVVLGPRAGQLPTEMAVPRSQPHTSTSMALSATSLMGREDSDSGCQTGVACPRLPCILPLLQPGFHQ